MIAAAMWFNSGILLFADAEPTKAGEAPKKILPHHYGSPPGARSIFVISEPGDGRVVAFRHCADSLASIAPTDCTIDRMREAVERCLVETADDEVDFVVLYAPTDKRYALFRTTGTKLQEVVGYDCEGSAAYLGHYVMRDRYASARSMDTLDLNTVFSIAIDTLEAIRATHETCGKSSEMVVMYADGHVSDVQRIPHDTRKERNLALTGLART